MWKLAKIIPFTTLWIQIYFRRYDQVLSIVSSTVSSKRKCFVKLFDQRSNKQPTILYRGAEIKLDNINLHEVLNDDSFAVVVEDCHIALTPDFIHAFGIMIAVHYVFNLSYVAPSQATMVFIQKLILDMAENYRAPTKVLNLIAKIRKNILN